MLMIIEVTKNYLNIVKYMFNIVTCFKIGSNEISLNDFPFKVEITFVKDSIIIYYEY